MGGIIKHNLASILDSKKIMLLATYFPACAAAWRQGSQESEIYIYLLEMALPDLAVHSRPFLSFCQKLCDVNISSAVCTANVGNLTT